MALFILVCPVQRAQIVKRAAPVAVAVSMAATFSARLGLGAFSKTKRQAC